MTYHFTPFILASAEPEFPNTFQFDREVYADYGDLCDDLLKTASDDYQDNVIAWAVSECARMGWACLVPNGPAFVEDLTDDGEPGSFREVVSFDLWTVS